MVIWAASSPYFALTYPLQRSWEVTIRGLPDVKNPPSRFINPFNPEKSPWSHEFLLHLESTVLADEFEFGFMESIEAQFEEVLVTEAEGAVAASARRLLRAPSRVPTQR